MNTITFEIPGDPIPKGRHRTTRAGIQFTPKNTIIHENLIKGLYETKNLPYHDTPLIMSAIFYHTPPASISKKKLAQMLDLQIFPAKKPDIDNLCKSVQDGLNAVAYKDDSQVYCSLACKIYSMKPRTLVILGTDPQDIFVKFWELTFGIPTSTRMVFVDKYQRGTA